jgi:hypothetical protein
MQLYTKISIALILGAVLGMLANALSVQPLTSGSSPRPASSSSWLSWREPMPGPESTPPPESPSFSG